MQFHLSVEFVRQEGGGRGGMDIGGRKRGSVVRHDPK